MNILGRVRNGVVVLDSPVLPEGAEVMVAYVVPVSPDSPTPFLRVELPLVRSRHPGQHQLTPERVAELLDDLDVSA